MFSESTPLQRPDHRSFGTLSARSFGLATLLALLLGCGHKEPPVPPPLRHPAATKDLVVEQRGEELILSFGFPQTTVSGTPLEPLGLVEIWEVVRPIPEWSPPTAAEDDEARQGADSDAAATAPSTGNGGDDEGVEALFESVPGGGDDPSRPDPEPVAEPSAGDEAPTDEIEGLEPEKGETVDSEADEISVSDEADGGSEPVEVRIPTKEELVAVSKEEFAAVAALRVSFDAAAVEAATVGDRIVLTLPIEVPASARSGDLPESAEFGSSFAIKTGITRKLISGFSNIATIAHRDVPEPPSDFVIEPDQNRVAIRWRAGEKDDETIGFHVHRREAQNPRYGQALALVPMRTADEPEQADEGEMRSEPTGAEAVDPEAFDYEYSDRTAVLGQRYIYALTTVSNRSPLVESAITVERELDYTDRFAPSSPRNAIALAESGRIRLLWDAAPESDVDGYLVERAADQNEFSRLIGEPIEEPEFNDRQVVSGRSYRYRVIAVDTSGNESTPSTIVEVRAP